MASKWLENINKVLIFPLLDFIDSEAYTEAGKVEQRLGGPRFEVRLHLL